MKFFNQYGYFLRSFLLPLLFAGVLGASQTASATTDDAARLVHQLGNQTIATLQTPGLTAEQRETRFRYLLTQASTLPSSAASPGANTGARRPPNSRPPISTCLANIWCKPTPAAWAATATAP